MKEKGNNFFRVMDHKKQFIDYSKEILNTWQGVVLLLLK